MSDADDATTPYQTNRWRGVVAVGLAAAAVGLAADKPTLIFAAVPGLLFAAYPRVSSPPAPAGTLEIDRRLSDESPAPGDTVEVTVTVRNVGSETLFDCRIVDGVPAALTVVDGVARGSGLLRPGGETTFTYSIEAEDGSHAFDPATVLVRDLTGAWEVETTVGTETTVNCTLGTTTSPARELTLESVGRVLSEQGGTGVEFHRTREYRRGDSMNRVDWNRYARNGELTTIEYREEQAAAVVLLVDAREVAYRGAPDEPHAVVRSTTAARQLFDTLLSRRNRVGVATLGRDVAWLPPDAGANHRTRAASLFASSDVFAPSAPDAAETPTIDEQVTRLRALLPETAQVVLLSPLCDDDIVEVSRLLEAHGHPVTVLSPDATGGDTAGERIAVSERRTRLHELRQVGIDAIDWGTDEPLGATLAARGGAP